MITLIALVVGLAVGFGAGRVKNTAKLKAVTAEVAAAEAKLKAGVGSLEVKAQAEIASVISGIKAKL